jgi:hypothetical protein
LLGNHTITANYNGNVRFAGSSGMLTQTVSPIPTATTLTPPFTILLFGGPVTLTATISPATASGEVTFVETDVGTANPKTVIGPSVAVSNGMAAATITFAFSSYEVQAHYSSNGPDFADSTSNMVTVETTGI